MNVLSQDLGWEDLAACIAQHGHHIVRKPMSPCGEAQAENNQDLWLTSSAELSARN